MKVNLIKNLTIDEIVDLKILLLGGFKEHDYSGAYILKLLFNNRVDNYFDALTSEESEMKDLINNRQILIDKKEKENLIKVLKHNLKVFEDYEETEVFFSKRYEDVMKIIEKI